ncbi:MAG: hypothetical protein JOZ17_09790 [Acetobacteraceae bacterium]|nr:hypothetical protein [Acetobacteraceae bacterium]
MVGDQSDILARLKAVLPAGWFSDATPVLDAILSGPAWGWSWVYNALQYVKSQTRIATATGVWLDVAAVDFFGARIVRKGRSDATFSAYIRREVLRDRGTRAAVAAILTDLTGRPPAIFEPSRPADTGAWGGQGQGTMGLGYGAAGGWGSLSLPFQAFVTAYRPRRSGIAQVTGWCAIGGGYRTGSIEYASLAMTQGPVTDADIYASVASVMPVAAIAWTRISN